MKPKIAYLIDDNAGWGDDPDWRFYTEDDAPQWKVENFGTDRIKRIVYWELENESGN